MTKLGVAVVQFQHRAGDKAYNLGRIEDFARRAKATGAAIVVMPEMCVGGYWHVPGLDASALQALAEPVTGPSMSRVASLAVELGIGIGAGWLERGEDGRLYNAWRLCLPDGGGHTHRKLHAFEHQLIASGSGFTVFDTPWGIRVAILICWDNNLIENVRACALMGAQLLLAPHQTGGTHSRSPGGMKPIPVRLWERRHSHPEPLAREFTGANGRAWLMRWLPARAHDNGIFIAFSNGVGWDAGEIRTGNAMILDPYGRIVGESITLGDALVTRKLDFDLVAGSSGQRWMRGRRPDLYALLAEPRGDELPPRAVRFGPA